MEKFGELCNKEDLLKYYNLLIEEINKGNQTLINQLWNEKKAGFIGFAFGTTVTTVTAVTVIYFFSKFNNSSPSDGNIVINNSNGTNSVHEINDAELKNSSIDAGQAK